MTHPMRESIEARYESEGLRSDVILFLTRQDSVRKVLRSNEVNLIQGYYRELTMFRAVTGVGICCLLSSIEQQWKRQEKSRMNEKKNRKKGTRRGSDISSSIIITSRLICAR